MTAIAIAGTRRSMKELVDGTLRVQIDIDPAYRDEFLKSFSKIDMPVALAPLIADFERAAPTPAEAPRADWASALYKSGWFYNPKVLAQLGPDEEFRTWIQDQPSAYSGEFSEYVEGDGRCIAAHVRRAGESGTGYKAPYACIPLTNDEHQRQHKDGESALGGGEWFDKMRAKYVAAWGHARLREIFDVDSLTKIPQRAFVAWAVGVGLQLTLPLALRTQ